MRDALTPQPDSSPPALGVMLCLVGLMLAGGTWFGGTLIVKQKAIDVRRGWNLQRAMVAAADLPAGTVLRLEHLSPQDIPEQFTTAGLFTDARALEGKTLAFALPKGTPIHAGALTDQHVPCESAR